MRLIDAGLLLDHLSGRLESMKDYDEIKDVVNNMQTAYDVDKVKTKIMEVYGCHNCEQCDTMACTECAELEVLKDICEIVNQGGVYDDCCEWKEDKGGGVDGSINRKRRFR